ncbi:MULTISPECIES: hypothetical protein [unclassified Lysinibacillus]|uniref:hypothetical protein n=1 Tax=unclassified Lysinibacillus TaxID=2636778 RepID=UPI002012FC78|nr:MULTISPECIES: hypothetical protein [unclassified Lysinibacillus]MCL1696763.1 hypothetical protein [Lysinibacillus sp. BPa_S21]MCL1702671.1 hypothetical protein [Lysinibacillus sp. Bpr_S20]
MRFPTISSDTLKLLGVENKLTPISMPSFSGINAMPTKSAPAMSEEKYKEAIIAQAKKDFENGKCGGHKNPSYMTLKNSFVSVVSPDRKGSISQMLRQLPFMQRGNMSYLEIKDARGNITSTYSPHNGWHAIGTREEQRRESEFDAIYIETWRALKAEAQQQVKPTSSSIDTFI